MLTLEVIVRGSSNFIGFRDICSKALLDAGFVVMLLLVLHLWGDLLEIGWRSDRFAASLFYYRISRGPKGSNISTSFIYSNSVHRLGDNAADEKREGRSPRRVAVDQLQAQHQGAADRFWRSAALGASLSGARCAAGVVVGFAGGGGLRKFKALSRH